MEIQENKHGAVAVVKPVGPVLHSDAEELKERLIEVQQRSLGRLVLDTSAIPFIDSRGIEVLVEVNEELHRSGRSLKLSGLNEVIREVLDLTDVASMFEHFLDVNSAVRSFL